MAERRNALERDAFRWLLVRGLRLDGLGTVCSDEPSTFDDLGNRMSQVVTTGMFLGITFVIVDHHGWGFYQWGATAFALGALVLLTAKAIGPVLAALLMAVSWSAIAGYQFIVTDFGDFALTVALPFGLATAAWGARARRMTVVAKSAPLLLPVTLTVLLIPLFTADLWQAAHALTPLHLVFLATLTILPLSVVYRRRVRTEVPRVVADVLATVSSNPNTPEKATKRLLRLLDDDQKKASLHDQVSRSLKQAWGDREKAIEPVQQHAYRHLEGQLVRRVLSTALGMAVTVTGYVYLLAWTLVPVSAASKWIGAGVPTTTIAGAGLQVHLPLGTYVTVASLFGVVATAVLLAFVVTEDRYSRALSDVMLQEPLEDGLSLALPYVAMYGK